MPKNQLLQNFCAEYGTYTEHIAEVLSVEVKDEAWVTCNGVDIPLPLHFIADLVVRTKDDKTVVIDHKSKGIYTQDDEVPLVLDLRHPGKPAENADIGRAEFMRQRNIFLQFGDGLVPLFGKAQRAAGGKAADFELHLAEMFACRGQIFGFEGSGVDGENIAAETAHFDAGEAEVFGYRVNIRP